MIRILIYFSLVVFLMGTGIFATQNQQLVNLKFSLTFVNLESINLPLGLVLIFSAGLGAIVITGLQLGNLKARSEFSNPTPSRSSFRSTQPVKPAKATKTKDEIKDFDDDFDDDWG